MKSAIAAKAKANQGCRTDIPQISAECLTPVDTRQELARLADVSHDTVRKVEQVAEQAPESIKDAARRGNLSVNAAYKLTKALHKASVRVLAIVEQYVIEHPETVEILKRLEQNKSASLDEIEASGCIQPGEESEAVQITDSPLDKLPNISIC